ncbi:HNH endonuclease [Amycolatopsis sp. NBC_00345]|uniref:YDG/SRA domain-containing protein n=1 Tax=Amycolatopsis sp. NBC_00345 TaxID=2975955 RepID=UPI002E266F4A
MDLADVNGKHVEAAIEEYDQLGKGKFLAKYRVKPAERFYVMRGDWAYEIEAVLGMVPGVEAEAAAAHLAGLGSEVQDRSLIPRFGPIPGIPEGRAFIDRRSAAGRRVHRALQAGIVGIGKRGAESIVVSGGYVDEDYGTTIIYTGHGGRDADTEEQIRDQTFDDPGNAALCTSMIDGGVVRVVRGAHIGSEHAPPTGYRYEGLFQVEDASYVKMGGFRFCRFRMVKLDLEVDVLAARLPVVVSGEKAHDDQPVGNLAPGRRLTAAQRTVRITKVTRTVKEIHENTCQMCDQQLVVGDRSYSEGAHIQALGAPHGGPDVVENVLCLCPNCHVLFDFGALIVQPDHSLSLNGQPFGHLRAHPQHQVDDKYLAHHREANRKA